MAIPHLSLRSIVLISTSVLFMAVILRLSVPVVTEFLSSEVVLTWLRPPYLYLIINCIIIIIVASSKLQNDDKAVVEEYSPREVVPPPPAPVKVEADYAAVYDGVVGRSGKVEVQPPVIGYGHGEVVLNGEDFDVGGQVESVKTTTLDLNAAEDVSCLDEMAVSTSLGSSQVNAVTEYLVSSYERPPVSGRIGHRKGVKSTPEGGRTLGVSKPKRHETLENTWKTITEGRSMPLARHLKKSDTWETHNRVGHLQQVQEDQVNKSQKFTDRSTAAQNLTPVKLRREPSGSGKLRKEPSPSQDELNRRVEAFIKKFNEDMRLQRQESLNQYMEMINRGAH